MGREPSGMLSQNRPSRGPQDPRLAGSDDVDSLLGHEWGCLHTTVLGTSGSTVSPLLRRGARAGVRDSASNLPQLRDVPGPLGGVVLQSEETHGVCSV